VALRPDKAYSEYSRSCLPNPARLADNLFDISKDPVRVFEEGLAGRRQSNLPAVALQQGKPNFFLQITNLGANG
jgi:hypothetical protein